jgi:hypothetical protein
MKDNTEKHFRWLVAGVALLALATFVTVCNSTKDADAPPMASAHTPAPQAEIRMPPTKDQPATTPAAPAPEKSDADKARELVQIADDFGVKVQTAIGKWECPDISTEAEKVMWRGAIVSSGFKHAVQFQLTGMVQPKDTDERPLRSTTVDGQADGYRKDATVFSHGGGFKGSGTWVDVPDSYSVLVQNVNTDEYAYFWFHKDGCTLVSKGTATAK